MITAMISFNPDHPSTEEDQRVDWIGAFCTIFHILLSFTSLTGVTSGDNGPCFDSVRARARRSRAKTMVYAL